MADDFDLLTARRAVFRSGLRSLEKLVALALLDHWSRKTETFPSVERLAAWTSLDRRSVLRCLRALEQTGAIVVTRNSGRPNVYALGSLMALPVSESHRCQPETSDTESPVTESHQCQPDTPPVSESHGTSVTESPEVSHEVSHQVSQGESAPTEGEKRPGAKRGKRKPGTRAPEVELPSDWVPSDAHRAFASKHALNVELEAVKFRGNAEQNARRVVSWNGAFTTWLGKSVGFAQAASRRAPVQQGGSIRETKVF